MTASVAGHRIDRSTLPLLLTLGLGVFAGALDLGVLSPALPALSSAFGVGSREIAWVFTLYLLANVVGIPIASQFADRLGRRPVYIACVATFAVGSIVAILAQSYAVFLVARAIQALGAGGIFPVATAAIADRVPLERRGAALGLVAATWGIAAVLGPILGGVLTNAFSWHWIFAANVPLATIVIVLAARTIPPGAARLRGPLDVWGLVLLCGGLLAMMFGLTRIDVRGAQAASNLAAGIDLAIALAAFVAFAFVERRAVAPVIPPQFFAGRTLRVTYGLELLIGMLEGALFFIPAALVAAQHLSLAVAGGFAAIGAITFVAVIPIAGRAIDSVGSRVVLILGAAMVAIGLALFAVWMQSMPLCIVAIIIAGIGFGALLGPPTRYIITREVGSERRATAVGLLSIFLILGQIVGGSLAGGIIGSELAGANAYSHAYVAFAILAAVAVLVACALERESLPKP